MRNIFLFIRSYFNFLFFLFLTGVSLYMLFSYNKYHQAVYSSVAGEVTGKISKQYNKIEYYFHLKSANDSLLKANEMLYNRLMESYEGVDTMNRLVIDSLLKDSVKIPRKYLYMQAKVIRNSVNQPNNYIQVHRGRLQGVKPDMGAIATNGGVIGTVIEASENYSVIMSLLHEQSFISARLKKSGETGIISWDGKDRHILILKDISKAVQISAGDTVVTSGFSQKFPPNLVIGYVKDILNDKASSTYTVRVTPAANFDNLQFTYIIDNLQKEEPEELLKKVRK